MPRVKNTDQIETLERQQKELAKKLNEAKAKERARAKEIEDRKAAAAGRLVVSELLENATGPLAAAFRAVANIKMTKPGDRALFELPDLSAAGNGAADHARAPEKVTAH